MKFIDRQAEMDRLASFARPGGGGLGLLWGRRRVGKTRFLLEWGQQVGGLYTVSDQSAEQVQRRYFAEALSTVFDVFGEAEFPDWRALFRALFREAKRAGWTGPLIIDEFPYLVASQPALPSILQGFVDQELRSTGTGILLAGSSRRMMQGLQLDRSSPLFGRAALAFELKPLPAGYIGSAFGETDASRSVRQWSAWGGIPRYWELAEPFGVDLDAAVESLVLDPSGPLHQEPDRLLVEELPPAAAVRPILDAAGAGAHRPSELASRVGVSATSLGHALTRLQELGLLERELPYGEPERGGKRSLYKIADPFTRMWFRVVAPHRAALAAGGRAVRRNLWRQHAGRLASEAWEDLCRASVPHLIRSAGESWGPARRYWKGGGPEWDVVAESIKGDALLLAEVKWSARPVAEDEIGEAGAALRAKGVPKERWAFPKRVVHALFVPEIESRRRASRPFEVVTAREVLAALRT